MSISSRSASNRAIAFLIQYNEFLNKVDRPREYKTNFIRVDGLFHPDDGENNIFCLGYATSLKSEKKTLKCLQKAGN
jgi:hypothetical protein